jgi:hypothetical protein
MNGWRWLEILLRRLAGEPLRRGAKPPVFIHRHPDFDKATWVICIGFRSSHARLVDQVPHFVVIIQMQSRRWAEKIVAARWRMKTFYSRSSRLTSCRSFNCRSGTATGVC